MFALTSSFEGNDVIERVGLVIAATSQTAHSQRNRCTTKDESPTASGKEYRL